MTRETISTAYSGATDERPVELCEYCTLEEFGLPGRSERRAAVFWVKTPWGYGQACEQCADELVDAAPTEACVVHDAPGRYNVAVLAEPGEVFSERVLAAVSAVA